MEEIWKDIKGYEGLYQISDRGNVKSLNYNNTGKNCILKSSNNGNGYLCIGLRINGKTKTRRVHRLVCEAFLPNPENKETVNHKNGIKTDNRLENLEWATYSENNKHSYIELGKKGTMTGKLGKNHNRSITVCRYSKSGEYIDEFSGACEAERITKIYNSHIIACCKGYRKSAGNYIWKYK